MVSLSIRNVLLGIFLLCPGFVWADSPTKVEPMEWNPPKSFLKTRKTEQLLTNPASAIGSRLIDLGKPPLRAKSHSQESIGPRKIGYPRDVTPLGSNEKTDTKLDWKQIKGGIVGSLAIRSSGAEAIRIGVRIQAIPENAEVRFFSSDASPVSFATGKQITDLVQKNLAAGDSEETARVYWSPLIASEIAGIEIFLPPGIKKTDIQISIPQISHIYETPASHPQQSPQPQSNAAYCEVDAMCYPDWLPTSKAVAKIAYVTTGHSYICSGTLLNDKASDGIPYFLTANHCMNTQSSASSIEAYWFYYSTRCNSGIPNPGIVKTSGGGTLLYNSSTTDVSFLRLNASLPAGVMFSGWTTYLPIIGQAGTGLHDPQGDLRKISFGNLSGFENCITKPDESFLCEPSDLYSGNFMEITFYEGITEGGSSGSGIFDQDKYLYGQLYGGNLSCQYRAGSDTYGRFDKSYTNGNLGQWLSPEPPEYSLSVTNAGGGIVTSRPSGISCGNPSAMISQAYISDILTKAIQGLADSTFDAVFGVSHASTPSGDSVAPTPYPLYDTGTVNLSGVGIGTLPSYSLNALPPTNGTITTSPAGINCGSSCSAPFNSSSVVTLTATPNTGYTFSGWTGACSGTGACSVTMRSAQSVGATFTKSAEGSCSATFPIGSSVSLSAMPNSGYAFSGWSGACSGSGACSVAMNSNQSVTANFSKLPDVYSKLTVSRPTQGTITGSSVNINCGIRAKQCTSIVQQGTTVTLSAKPKAGYYTKYWTGCSSTSADSCSVAVGSGPIKISAKFAKKPK